MPRVSTVRPSLRAFRTASFALQIAVANVSRGRPGARASHAIDSDSLKKSRTRSPLRGSIRSRSAPAASPPSGSGQAAQKAVPSEWLTETPNGRRSPSGRQTTGAPRGPGTISYASRGETDPPSRRGGPRGAPSRPSGRGGNPRGASARKAAPRAPAPKGRATPGGLRLSRPGRDPRGESSGSRQRHLAFEGDRPVSRGAPRRRGPARRRRRRRRTAPPSRARTTAQRREAAVLLPAVRRGRSRAPGAARAAPSRPPPGCPPSGSRARRGAAPSAPPRSPGRRSAGAPRPSGPRRVAVRGHALEHAVRGPVEVDAVDRLRLDRTARSSPRARDLGGGAGAVPRHPDARPEVAGARPAGRSGFGRTVERSAVSTRRSPEPSGVACAERWSVAGCMRWNLNGTEELLVLDRRDAPPGAEQARHLRERLGAHDAGQQRRARPSGGRRGRAAAGVERASRTSGRRGRGAPGHARP